MTDHDPLFRIYHMHEVAQEAVSLSAGRTREDFDNDRLLHLAIIRLLEVLGEAANRASDEIKARHPEIPWRQAISFRNQLIHAYDTVDSEYLWSCVRQDLPPLIEQLDAIIAEYESERSE